MNQVQYANAQTLDWVVSTKNIDDKPMALIKSLMNTPAIMEVWYEPGYIKNVHQHPMDEIFFILKGSMMMHGTELTKGSAIFVPGNTLYGPEYALSDGVHFLRVELWDTENGRPGGHGEGRISPGVGKYTAYDGPLDPDGLPNTGGALTPPLITDRKLDPVDGSFSRLSEEVNWNDLHVPGSHDKVALSLKRLLHPNPDLEEVQRHHGDSLPPRSGTMDRIFYVIDGQMTMNDHNLDRGSALFIPKNTEYQSQTIGLNGVHYIRVILESYQHLQAELA